MIFLDQIGHAAMLTRFFEVNSKAIFYSLAILATKTRG
jgi:hypothetical protein